MDGPCTETRVRCVEDPDELLMWPEIHKSRFDGGVDSGGSAWKLRRFHIDAVDVKDNSRILTSTSKFNMTPN